MAAAAEKPVTVTLGRMGGLARRLVDEGRYASISEVMRAGLRALEREEAALDELIKAKVMEALADPRPPIPMDDAFARAFAKLAERDDLD
jgi:antitoxin ParD1/3/4